MEFVVEGYVARDKEGTLHWFEEMPYRFHEEGMDYWVSNGLRYKIPLRWGFFPYLKWEDNPIPVTMSYLTKFMLIENNNK